MSLLFLLSLPGLVVIIILAGVFQLIRAKQTGKKRPGAANFGLNMLDISLRPGSEHKVIQYEKEKKRAIQIGSEEIMTTGNFKSDELLAQERECELQDFNLEIAQELGGVATKISQERNLGVAISIRIDEWEIFKAALPGAKPENDGWINRKANVVNLKHHSTMYERVKSEEDGTDWHLINKVKDETHAIHGGGFPIYTPKGFSGILLISGLPQVEDHLLAVEILKAFKSKKNS